MHALTRKQILFVENSVSNVKLLKYAFGVTSFSSVIHVVSSAKECLDFLYRRNDFTDKVTPDLILLDIATEDEDGAKILDVLGTEQNLKDVKVIVFSASKPTQNGNTRASFIQKPEKLDEFVEAARLVSGLWGEGTEVSP